MKSSRVEKNIYSFIEIIATKKKRKIEYYAIYTMNGICILNSFLDKLPLSFQESGKYLLILNYEDGGIDSFKLVKEKENLYTQRII